MHKQNNPNAFKNIFLKWMNISVIANVSDMKRQQQQEQWKAAFGLAAATAGVLYLPLFRVPGWCCLDLVNATIAKTNNRQTDGHHVGINSIPKKIQQSQSNSKDQNIRESLKYSYSTTVFRVNINSSTTNTGWQNLENVSKIFGWLVGGTASSFP